VLAGSTTSKLLVGSAADELLLVRYGAGRLMLAESATSRLLLTIFVVGDG